MPGKPTPQDVHVNTALSEISIAYKGKVENLIADKVFPSVPVQKQSDAILELDKNDWLRDEADIRAPGTESAGGGFGVSADKTYFCKKRGYHKDLPYDVIANSDINNLQQQVAEFVAWKLLLNRENQWISSYFQLGKWGRDYTGHASTNTGTNIVFFDDGANSDPLEALDRGKEYIQGNTGYVPNILVIGQQIYNVLRRHPDVKETIKYTQLGVGSVELLATLFDVAQVLIGKTVYATNAEGGTAAYSFAFSDNMFLGYAPPSPGLLTPTAGYTFEWNGFNGMGLDVAVSDIEMPALQSVRIEGEMAYDLKLVCADLGVFYSNMVT